MNTVTKLNNAYNNWYLAAKLVYEEPEDDINISVLGDMEYDLRRVIADAEQDTNPEVHALIINIEDALRDYHEEELEYINEKEVIESLLRVASYRIEAALNFDYDQMELYNFYYDELVKKYKGFSATVDAFINELNAEWEAL